MNALAVRKLEIEYIKLEETVIGSLKKAFFVSGRKAQIRNILKKNNVWDAHKVENLKQRMKKFNQL